MPAPKYLVCQQCDFLSSLVLGFWQWGRNDMLTGPNGISMFEVVPRALWRPHFDYRECLYIADIQHANCDLSAINSFFYQGGAIMRPRI